MTPNIYNPKVHHKKLLAAIIIAAVAVMFLIRGILYQNGTLEAIQTLDTDEIRSRTARYEVRITDTAGDESVTGGGTVLDGRKNSTQDEYYTLTIATSCDVAGIGDNNGQNGILTVTLQDGTEVEGTLISADPSLNIAFVQCEYPEEIEAYYSRDLLERLSAGDPVYAWINGDLSSGTLVETEARSENVQTGRGMTIVKTDAAESSPEEQIPEWSGAGIYGSSGNYLGMMIQKTDRDRIICVSAVDIVKELNQQ